MGGNDAGVGGAPVGIWQSQQSAAGAGQRDPVAGRTWGLALKKTREGVCAK